MPKPSPWDAFYALVADPGPSRGRKQQPVPHRDRAAAPKPSEATLQEIRAAAERRRRERADPELMRSVAAAKAAYEASRAAEATQQKLSQEAAGTASVQEILRQQLLLRERYEAMLAAKRRQ